MAFHRIFILCTLVIAMANCRKKSETVGDEVREAGYEMTQEGWFGAVRDDNVPVMRKMIEGGFDFQKKDQGGDSALHIAAVAGAKRAAEYLLDNGIDIDAKGENGQTPLMSAVTADRPEMVQWLLSQGADPKLKNSDGFMALMLAVSAGREKAVGELAPYHREDLDSALLLASLVGHAEVIDELTNYGASVYARMEDGRTPLMLAAQNGHKEACAMLIDIGASRFATTESGATAQSMAVSAGHADLAELIEKGMSGDTIALESDGELAEAMGENFDKVVGGSEDAPEGNWEMTGISSSEIDEGVAARAMNKQATAEASTRKRLDDSPPIARKHASRSAGGDNTTRDEPVRNLENATVSGQRIGASSRTRTSPRAKLTDQTAASGEAYTSRESATNTSSAVEMLPLVMRKFRQRELPIEVKSISRGVASLRLAGVQPTEVHVSQGETIPRSNLVVVRMFRRAEHGKLNNGQPMEIGVVEVLDQDSGQKREWIEGRPASGHDPVALVEDAATGRLYLAKVGQKFRSNVGREFIVNDVRPTQLVIEDVESGEVQTLRLRGPRG